MERLQKIIARAGLASRREAERWIVEGRITVNGTVVDKLGSQADPFKDSIKIDGKRIKSAAAPLYYALHKPPGVITTLNDPQHRPDITPYIARLGEKRRVFPVGRLDYNTTGLLLLTNDGELAMRLVPSALWCAQTVSGEIERLSHRRRLRDLTQRHPLGRRHDRAGASAGDREAAQKRLGRNRGSRGQEARSAPHVRSAELLRRETDSH